MRELRAQLREWRQQVESALGPDGVRFLVVWGPRILAGILIVVGIVLPFFFTEDSGFMNATIIAVTYAVMGGIGNVNGAVLGGLIIGVIQAFADNRLKGGEWTEAVVFGYLIAIMVLRPRGLLGEETREAG